MPEPLPITATAIRRIRAWRDRRGLSAEQLAGAITASGYRIGRSSLANAEAGRVQTIPVDLVVHAAKVLRVPVAALLDDSPCDVCDGVPPRGMTCGQCGSSTPLEATA